MGKYLALIDCLTNHRVERLNGVGRVYGSSNRFRILENGANVIPMTAPRFGNDGELS